MADTTLTARPVTLSQRVARVGQPPISYLMEQAVANPNLISLAAGLVDQQSLPVEPTREAVERVLGGDAAAARRALQYGTTDGDLRLRTLILEHLARLEGRTPAELGVTPDEVMVGTGSQQMLYLVGEILLDPGDIVIVGTPTYFVYLGALESLGARVFTVPCDDEGLDPEAVARLLAELDRRGLASRVKLVYDVSYFANPTGLSLGVDRRSRLLEVVRDAPTEHRVFLLEDAAYRELRYRGDDVPSVWSFDDSRHHVLYAGTFSKPYAPGLKTGYLVLPRELRGALLVQKGHHDFGSANFTHQILAELLDTGAYDRHVELLRRVYADKQAVMLDELDAQLATMTPTVHWTRPAGGLYVWMTLPEGTSTAIGSPLFERCLEAGVLYVPGRFCFPPDEEEEGDRMLRLSFGNLPSDRVREGVRRLAAAIRAALAAD